MCPEAQTFSLRLLLHMVQGCHQCILHQHPPFGGFRIHIDTAQIFQILDHFHEPPGVIMNHRSCIALPFRVGLSVGFGGKPVTEPQNGIHGCAQFMGHHP